MRCQKCGQWNWWTNKHCSRCGSQLEKLDARQKRNEDEPPVNILNIITIAAVVLIAVCLIVLLWPDGAVKPPPTEPTKTVIAEPKVTSPKGTTPKPATHQHSWKDATCTEAKTCKICGITTGSAAGHDWTEATYSSPKTCITCGETSGDILRVDPYSVELPDLSSFFRHKYTENMWGEAHLVTTVCDPEYLQSGFEEYLQLLLDEKYQLELMETRENRSSVDYIFRYTGENDEIEWIEHKNGYSYHVKLTIYENKNAISLHTHPEFVLVDSGSTASHIS